MSKEIEFRYNKLASCNSSLSCSPVLEFAIPTLGDVCLDLGCGRGNDAIALAKQVGENGMVYGVDTSTGMITKAMYNAELEGIKNVKFIWSELLSLTFEPKMFDLIVSNCALNHVSDKQKMWKIIFTLLKPGGKFVIGDIYSLEQISEQYKIDPVAVAECWAGAVTKDEYLSHVSTSGFEQIEILHEKLPYKKGKADLSSFILTGKKPII